MLFSFSVYLVTLSVKLDLKHTMTNSEKDGKKSEPLYKFAISDEEQISAQDVTATDIWTGFKERTSAHGVPHVHQARGIELFDF